MLKKLCWQLERSMKKEVLKMTSTFTLIFLHIITRVTQDRFILGTMLMSKGENPLLVPKSKTFSEQQIELVLFMTK